jgi:hypothetical protein
VQYSVGRQLLELEHGVPLAAAAQRLVAGLQYFAVPHHSFPKPDVHASPTCTGPHVPGRLVPPSLTTTRFRQLSVEPEQACVLEHG